MGSDTITPLKLSKITLLQAAKKFKDNNLRDTEFYLEDTRDLPFSDAFFDLSVCDLSLNFLGNIETFIKELKRVIKDG